LASSNLRDSGVYRRREHGCVLRGRVAAAPCNGGFLCRQREALKERRSGWGRPTGAGVRAERRWVDHPRRVPSTSPVTRAAAKGTEPGSVSARRVTGRAESVATAGAGLSGLEVMRGCGGKAQRRITRPVMRRWAGDGRPPPGASMTHGIAERVGAMENALFTHEVCRHSAALPHGLAAARGTGRTLALPTASELGDERSPHCRSDQRERTGGGAKRSHSGRGTGAQGAAQLA